MRLIYVRHGHPNYELDCLTPRGHQHAAAAAQRLKEEGIEKIYSSTCGRAMETAKYTADLLGLSIEGHDYMREIGWGTLQGEPLYHDGHPWDTADKMVLENESLVDPLLLEKEPFCRNDVKNYVQLMAEKSDAWLSSLGFQREGLYYRCLGETYHTVAAFGHGGASAALFSRLLNLPFLFLCCSMGLNYTGITVLNFKNEPGQLVTPQIEVFNDARHIRHLEIENVYNR